MGWGLLSSRQAELRRRERQLLHRLAGVLAGWEADPKDLRILHDALEQLDEFFLLVVVGEFNSGKSALINALLGERYLAEGVTPTTAQIHILRHGDKGEPRRDDRGAWVLTYPADFLRDVNIVDTPGTNAVLREHEAISRDFVPRSDLVLFITSADRPFTESERAFLEHIRDWGKKVVLVINKVDLLEGDAERQAVVAFVHDHASRLLGTPPPLFPLSAKRALAARLRGEPSPPEFRAFETFLFQTLTEVERVRLKLSAPLGVARRLVRSYQERVDAKLALLEEDLEVLNQIEEQLDRYRQDMEQEFEYHRLRVESLLNAMVVRGEEFFDETLRLTQVVGLLNTRALRKAFEREVIGDTPEQIELQVQEMIDWMVDREARQWRTLARQLGRRRRSELLEEAGHEAAGGFEYNRQQLLHRIGRATQRVVAEYDRKAEAAQLVADVQAALTQMAIAEVGAIGLGALLKVLLVGATADATGILAAGLLGVLGLGILPYRRGRAKADLRRKVTELQGRLERVLHDTFAQEVERSVRRLRDTVAPYARFVRTEHGRLRELHRTLDSIGVDVETLLADVEGETRQARPR
ncbi:MAG: dynamin family protein [Ardenticatenia bacterium]|nr:dynamin family protein [Ardenticatenia bacterium]